MLNLSKFKNYKLADSLPSFQVNHEKFNILIALVNDDEEAIPISKGSISSLLINDNLFDLSLSGSIVIDNTSNAIEKFKNGSKNDGSSLYKFKNNGRDYIIIQIRPIMIGNDESSIPQSVKDYAFIEERFVIYSIQDLEANGKYLKLDFHSVEMQMMVEENSYFSTASDKTEMAKDSDRRLPTGKAIKNALKKVISEKDMDPDSWEDGKNSIFYTATQNENIFNTVSNILKYHVSANNSPCILKKNQVTKLIELVSLETIFKNSLAGDGSAGSRFLDAYSIDTNENIDQGTSNFLKVNRPKGVSLNPANVITNFKLDRKDYSTTFSQVKAQFVSSYDKHKGTFSVRNTTIESAIPIFQKLFIKPMQVLGTANSNVSINNEMLVNNFFTTATESRFTSATNMGLTNLLFNLIFLNDEASFNIKGATYLKSGYFIHIEPSTTAEPNEFNKNLVGMYLITKAEHIFNGDTFYTKVSAVKTYKQ